MLLQSYHLGIEIGLIAQVKDEVIELQSYHLGIEIYFGQAKLRHGLHSNRTI